MLLPPIPSDEAERLSALHRLKLLDSAPDPAYQALAELAARLLGTPVAAISLIDAGRRWTKAGVGLVHGDEDPRDVSFCAHVVGGGESPWVVEDATTDPRFADNPLVTGGRVGFYAGAAVRTADGHAVGTLCVIDPRPRRLGREDRETLRTLADAVGAHVQLRGQQLVAETRSALFARLAEQSRTDGLTGVLNRRALDDELHLALLNARVDASPVSIAILDLDHFRAYNDAHGHGAGDALLKACTAGWSAGLRAGDVLARYGGEEFVVVLPGCSAGDAHGLVDRLRRHTPAGQTCSAGVATWDGGETIAELLERAHRALHRAKGQGRDVVCVA
jgi:diguanylate cyclase (GGDEF)-like protein